MSQVNNNSKESSSTKDSNPILKNNIGKMPGRSEICSTNEIYCGECLKLFLKRKKIQGYMNKWLNVIYRLSETTGISQNV